MDEHPQDTNRVLGDEKGLDPAVPGEDVEAHGIEEDNGEDAETAITVCGTCL